ncbi:YqaJ viral recombinase family protein [Salinarimonas soli]|uniref:Endonuclease n=1 Tax=Salinarimonas soli TaxID=1638099 RepID=A0A5B2V5K1_9HYPH|nr:YqaJ viral recombinase family protein [Salinarimonas soli]KAA2234803.1 endonuclease [Salinarimonas soli]
MSPQAASKPDRCSYIGGSDARTIMSTDEAALVRLWQEKRGEAEPEDLSGNLLVQFGCATEDLNRRWFEGNTGHALGGLQRFVRHPRHEWMGATLDGFVEAQAAVYEAKFMLPWSFSEEAAADKHMAQLQHNMLVTGSKRAYLSILTGGAKWVLIEVEADPVYQTVLLQVERIFWRCVQQGEVPRPFGVEAPRAKVPAVRVVDMSLSNTWAEYASVFAQTREAHGRHESAKAELKGLVPEDAREAFGHGVRAKRSKAGAISFELMSNGGSHALGL